MKTELEKLISCNYNLPPDRKPILQLQSDAKILIIGPAPGVIAHNTGIPWNDNSGNRLRTWLMTSESEFYNANNFALISMNFWYPGVDKHGNDKPPSLLCAEKFHRPLINLLKNIKLTLLIGHQAQKYILKEQAKHSMTATMQAWREYWPDYVPLPHPSWHNNTWVSKNKWFELELLLELRSRIRIILNEKT